MTQSEKDALFIQGLQDGKSGNERQTEESGKFTSNVGLGFLFGGPVGAVIGACFSTDRSDEKQAVYDKGYEKGQELHEKELIRPFK